MLEKEIKKIRKRNGWTQEYLATIINKKQPTISRIENNINNTTWKLLKKVLISLSIEANDLLTLKQKFILKDDNVLCCFKILIKNTKFRVNMLSNPINFAQEILNAMEKKLIICE